MTNLTERGLQVFAEIMGQDNAEQMRQAIESNGFGSDLSKMAADFAFGSVWSRDGLERKHRSLVVIGVLIAKHQLAELKNHIRIGLTNGLTPREIEEALIQTLPYVGFPAVANAASAIIEVLREKGIDTTTLTSHERGMV